MCHFHLYPGIPSQKASINEALRDLVERLADRLQEEANAGVTHAKKQLAIREREQVQATRGAGLLDDAFI